MGLFFLRLLTKRWQTTIFHSILAVSAVYGLFYTLTTLFVCGNPARLADSHVGSRKCLPVGFILSTGYIYGIINVIADWTFVLIPISILMESDLCRRSKISVGIIMGLGAIGSVSSVLRMVYLEGLLGSQSGIGLNRMLPNPSFNRFGTNRSQPPPSRLRSSPPQNRAPVL
jgi:hypothetical protein